MIAIYSLTIFLSAGVLFLVQPMLAKMLLPLFGGSPSVWNTCMVFFQGVLLAAYAYAHFSTRRLGSRRQSLVHLGVLAVACVALPIALREGAGREGGGLAPVALLVINLALACGLPFFLLSTTSPLLQRWIAETRDPLAANPYPLYAASNAGSLAGLLAYPLIIEPMMTLREQSTLASAGLLAVAFLHALSAWMLRRSPPPTAPGVLAEAESRRAQSNRPPTSPPASKTRASAPAAVVAPRTGPGSPGAPAFSFLSVRGRERFRWTALAFAPSSLLLGVTQHLSTDIVAMPMLWVVPLALYLVTFIVAFGVSPRKIDAMLPPLARLAAMGASAIALIMVLESRRPIGVIVAFHLLAFFLAAMLAHAALARARPEPSRLTEFYLAVSVGGVLGGSFNAIIAPTIFRDVYEYPLALAAIMLARPALPRRVLWHDLAIPGALAAYLFAANLLTNQHHADALLGSVVLAGIPVLATFVASGGRVRFAACLALVLAMPFVFPRGYSRVLLAERTFFGVYRVARAADDSAMSLLHGTTLHGSQPLKDGIALDIPATYYHPGGPIGQAMTALSEDPRLLRVGLVGMGVGSLAAYAPEGGRFTFHEIDPAVVRIASDPRFFTYLDRSKGEWDTILGDGRRTMERVPDSTYGVIILDAFTSDAIPVHLLTLEAFRTYMKKLTPDGILYVHISNRYLDLRPVVAGAARELDVSVFVCEHRFPGDIEERIARDLAELARRAGEGADEATLKEMGGAIDALERERERLVAEGMQGSTWFALARDPAGVPTPDAEPRWRRILPRPEAIVWTDDYSNILSVFTW